MGGLLKLRYAHTVKVQKGQTLNVSALAKLEGFVFPFQCCFTSSFTRVDTYPILVTVN